MRHGRYHLLFFAALAAAVAVGVACARIQAAGNSFAWKASKGSGSIYLVGSVHMLTKDYYPLSPALDAAFADADLLVEEIDFGELLAPESQLELLTRGMLPGDRSLDQVVSPDTFALVSRRLEDLGLPVEPLKRFKPWSLALTLLGLEWQKAGFDPTLGLDRHFYDRARSEGKEVHELETLAFQLSRFDSMTADEQDRLLATTIRELETQMAAVTELADAWKAGDVPTVERIVLETLKQEPRLYRSLLVERNGMWLPKIEALLARPGRAIVVVGAAHLVGPDGLLAMLQARGCTIQQL